MATTTRLARIEPDSLGRRCTQLLTACRTRGPSRPPRARGRPIGCVEEDDPRALVDANAARQRDALEAADELARVDDRVVARRSPQSADDDRRVDLRARLGRGEDLGRLAVIGRDGGPLVEPVGLPGRGREGQAAGLLEVAVDALAADEGDQLVVVARALRLEDVDLVGEVAQAVGQAVGQAGLDDAAVSPARAVADDRLLEQHDVGRGAPSP